MSAITDTHVNACREIVRKVGRDETVKVVKELRKRFPDLGLKEASEIMWQTLSETEA